MSLQATLTKILIRYAMAAFAARKPSIEDWRAMFEGLSRYVKLPSDVRTEPVSAAGVPAEWITTPGIQDHRVHLHLHGGAYYLGSIRTHRDLASHIGRAAGMRSLVIDYRLAPEHPFPAALEDTINTYRWLLEGGYQPENIILSGDSAGGGLVLSAMVVLRDGSEPLPAGAVCISPWTDLALTGDSFKTKAKSDLINKPSFLEFSGPLYAGEHDLKNPLVSPLYADLHGLPPILVQVGSEEVLLDDSTRLAERAHAAGVDLTLEVWDGMVHVFQLSARFMPEARQAVKKIGKFMREQVGSASKEMG